jgi:hypothetical protein
LRCLSQMVKFIGVRNANFATIRQKIFKSGKPLPPDGVTARQSIDVVVNYLQTHAEERHESAQLSIFKGLSGWHC